ncbi:NAD(P)-dependent oxidoreductase [Patescibacteria group bacterium]|nr:NAD(P)-dependent oxidoreductase [Patescibacteria group bacterium]
MTTNRKYHIGIIGTGFIAKGLMHSLLHRQNLEISRVLTRRAIKTITDFPVAKKKLTNAIEELIRSADLVVECTGDVIHGTEMAETVLKAGLPVVTMNPELQITSGTILSQMGTFIEAEGDQPGALAALDAEVKSMGFKPIVYGNIKGFLNHNPTLEEMRYWAKKQSISLTQVVNFTDGTKLQIEQTLVANGLGATIACQGLTGVIFKNHEDGANRLVEIADAIGEPISDYVLSSASPAGVFIVAKLDKTQSFYIKHLKMGPGPNYIFTRPYHLCHLEIGKTIQKVLTGDTSYSFNNGPNPTIQVMAIAKRDVKAGEYIQRGIGGFVVRGEAVKIHDRPDGVPIGLLHKAELVKPVKKGKIVTFGDVRLPNTRALEMWWQTLKHINAISEDAVSEPPAKPQVRQAPRTSFRKWLPSIRPFTNLNLSSLFKK